MKKAEHLYETGHELGEGPIWDAGKGILCWLDIFGKGFFRMNPDEGKPKQIKLEDSLTAIGLRGNGGYIVSALDRVLLLNEKELEDTKLDLDVVRYNDGAVGPGGRFWIGTMDKEKGAFQGKLYRIDPDLSVTTVVEEVGTSNGIGWSLDGKYMYYTDSARSVIYRYSFDKESGEISDREEFIKVREEGEVPDGLAMDSEGCIYSAHFRGNKVVRYDPDGKEMEQVAVPVWNVTSCCFGDPDLKTLFITTAKTGSDKEHLKNEPHTGDIFAFHSETAGREEYTFGG